MKNLILDYRLKPWMIYGGKRPFFVKYGEMIEDVIKEFKLDPIKEQFQSPMLKASGMKSAAAMETVAYIDPDIFGGKRFAHLHYRGEIYMLNREQWQSFTARIKDNFISRLHNVNSISIEQLQDLNDAIDPIA
jgi:hypothetical protein